MIGNNYLKQLAFGEAAMRILENAIENPVAPKQRPTHFVQPIGIGGGLLNIFI